MGSARKRAAVFVDDAQLSPATHMATDASDPASTPTNSDIATLTRDALRSTVSLDAMINVLLTVAQVLQQLATAALKIAGAAQARISREDLPLTRKQFSDAIWKAAQHDYEKGDLTAGQVADRYGMTVKTVETHAWRDGWSKTVTELPPPLLPLPDPAQVTETGASKWAKIAHPAQWEPPVKWSTWLLQGGRGGGKTRAGAEWLPARAEATPNGMFAIVN